MIHPTAIVAKGAEIHSDATVGPYCVVGEHVHIGSDTELISHVVVSGHTHIGDRNRIFPFASIGNEPQDLKYHGEASRAMIGDDNTIRENVTINTGTEGGGMETRIGNKNMLMAYVHVAHDCQIGDEAILANCTTLAGHVEIADGVVIGGLSAIHQFIRIGCYVMIGGMSGITKDIPPFCLTAGGYRPGLVGLNIIGLKRRGFSLEDIGQLKQMYRILLQGSDSMSDKIAQAESELGDHIQARELLDFVRTAKRGLTMHRRDDLGE